MDFYLVGLSPQWQSCVEEVTVRYIASGKSTNMMGNAVFLRGTSLVSVDTLNMSMNGPNTFDIFVDHERSRTPSCFRDLLK